MRTQSTQSRIHQRIGKSRTVLSFLPVVPAILAAALVLGGCAATHVGDSWQCPVAQGAACTSVADTDPAVRTPGKTQGLATRTPLYQANTDGAQGSGAPATRPSDDTPCAKGCDPMAWLATWFRTLWDRDAVTEESTDAERPTAAAPAEPKPVPPTQGTTDAAGDGPGVKALRTKERIARIWIAPFVDADGVFREAHWVRTVLEPARWRLP